MPGSSSGAERATEYIDLLSALSLALVTPTLLRLQADAVFVCFLAGIIYDVIVEPPSVGSMTDEHGHQRPVAFLAYRWEQRPAHTQTHTKELCIWSCASLPSAL